MWQIKYVPAVPIDLRLEFDFQPCSEGVRSPWKGLKSGGQASNKRSSKSAKI